MLACAKTKERPLVFVIIFSEVSFILSTQSMRLLLYFACLYLRKRLTSVRKLMFGANFLKKTDTVRVIYWIAKILLRIKKLGHSLNAMF